MCVEEKKIIEAQLLDSRKRFIFFCRENNILKRHTSQHRLKGPIEKITSFSMSNIKLGRTRWEIVFISAEESMI